MVGMDTSYLEKQVSTIINKLHELFDEIGIPSHDRDSRESELFAALSETLHNQLRVVTNEKHALVEEAEKLITTIKQMQTGLDGKAANYDHDEDYQITYPLKPCLQALKERHKSVAKVHRDRYEQIKKLAVAIDSYSSHLEPSFIKVQLPPISQNAACPPTFDLSHEYFAALDDEFTRVYDEYQRRIETVRSTCAEIINLWAELGTPQAQTDANIIELSRESPEQLGLHADDVAMMRAKRDRLVDEKKAREKRIREMAAQIEQLWERLCIPEEETRQFLARNRGCGMRAINEYEDELGRLNELKKQNLGLFVEESRVQLQALWDQLYFSEEEMLDFTPAFSDVYSDALLAAHEAEIARLESLKDQRLPILSLIDRHKSLIKERDDLTASSQDASRLMLRGQKGEKRDPGKLLREEKSRKRIAKELPKVEADLQKKLETYDAEYGRPFLVLGEDYLEELAASSAVVKAPPPRSKTPAPVSNAPSHARSQSRSAAPAKNGTVKGAAPPPLRSKTPNNFQTIRGNPISQKPTPVASKANTSPSRIPARPPLSQTHGNNSPERKYMTVGAKTVVDDGARTVKNMGPPRLPPPKMRDLFVPPQQPASATPTSLTRLTSDFERSASVVRQVAPEDPYDDLAQSRAAQYSRNGYYPSSSSSRSYASSASSSIENQHLEHGYSTSSYGQHPYERSYPAAPPVASRPQSRQISQQSASSNASGNSGSAISGSENWETFDDASEDEADATATYYAKIRAQQPGRPMDGEGLIAHKRALPEQNWAAEKRMKNAMPPPPGRSMHAIEREGSEAAWTDESVY